MEHFKNLVAIAVADGVLDEAEVSFLEERAEEVGLPEEEVKRIMEAAEGLQFVVPLTVEDREDQLADIVFMSMVDGNIDDREYNLCLRIADKLGMERKEVDQVITLTKKLWVD